MLTEEHKKLIKVGINNIRMLLPEASVEQIIDGFEKVFASELSPEALVEAKKYIKDQCLLVLN